MSEGLRQGNNLKPLIRPLFRTLAPNGAENVAMAGSFLYIYAAAGKIALDFGQGETPLVAGDSIDFGANMFDGFRVVDLSGAANAVTIIVSTGKFDRKTITGALNPVVPSTIQTATDFALTGAVDLILAQNTARNTATVRALSTNAGVVRVGDNNIGAARGIPLNPNEYFTLSNTAAIYAFGTAGDKISVLTEDN